MGFGKLVKLLKRKTHSVFKSKRPRGLRLFKHPREYEVLKTRLEDVGQRLDSVVKEIFDSGKLPIIILPDTSMRNATYFLNAYLSAKYPEFYLNFKKKYGFGPCIHVLNARFVSFETRIPSVVGELKNVTPIILDFVATGKTVAKISSDFKKQFGFKDVKSLNVFENLFNLSYHNKPENDHVRSMGFVGKGGVLKKVVDQEVIWRRARYLDYKISGQKNNWFLERDLRKLLFNLGLQLGKQKV